MSEIEETKMEKFDGVLRTLSAPAFRALLKIGVRDFDSFVKTNLVNRLLGCCSPTHIFELTEAQKKIIDQFEKNLRVSGKKITSLKDQQKIFGIFPAITPVVRKASLGKGKKVEENKKISINCISGI